MENIIHINKEIISEENKKNNSLSTQNAKNIRNKRRNMNNFLAKNILSEYQKKTHFKALCTCSLDLSDSNKKKKEKNNKNNKNNKNDDKFNSFNSFNTLYNRRINYDNNNDLKYNSSINLYKKSFHNKKIYSKKELDYLKNLFTPHIEGKNSFGNNQKKLYDDENDGSNRIFRPANLVLINGKMYHKNDMKGISNAVLKECNYIKKCFESENAGEGKTMITRGMTVNEFTRKYGLPK